MKAQFGRTMLETRSHCLKWETDVNYDRAETQLLIHDPEVLFDLWLIASPPDPILPGTTKVCGHLAALLSQPSAGLSPGFKAGRTTMPAQREISICFPTPR